MNLAILQAVCPAEETLLAWADHLLQPGQRAEVEVHLAGCPACSAILLAANKRARALPDAVLPFRPRMVLALAAGAAGVAAVIFLALPLADRLHGKTGVDALASAVPERRLIEARLTGFDYHPMARAGSEREGATDDAARNWRLLNMASRIQESAARKPSVSNLHALGVSRLLLGQSGPAVSALEQALLEETAQPDPRLALEASQDAALLNDLSAALATDSARTANVAKGERALRAAERAWTLGKAPEAAWNRAVAMEAARGQKESEPAWRGYLTVDTSSPWAAEAQARAAHSAAVP